MTGGNRTLASWATTKRAEPLHHSHMNTGPPGWSCTNVTRLSAVHSTVEIQVDGPRGGNRTRTRTMAKSCANHYTTRGRFGSPARNRTESFCFKDRHADCYTTGLWCRREDLNLLSRRHEFYRLARIPLRSVDREDWWKRRESNPHRPGANRMLSR